MKQISKLYAIVVVRDDRFYFAQAVTNFSGKAPSFVFVNRLPFFGEPCNWQHTVEVAEAAGATVVVGEWHGEIEHWAAAGEHLLSLGYTDIENRLVRYESGGVVTSYTYQGSDGLKRSEQVGAARTTLVWDGDEYLQERS